MITDDLITRGVSEVRAGNFKEAERIFKELRVISPNEGRLCLASLFVLQNVPMAFSTPENARWLDLAEEEYRQILDSDPPESERQTAERGLKALAVVRQPFVGW